MKTNKHLAVLALALGVSLPFAANAAAPNYSYVGLNYAHISPDSSSGLDSGNGYLVDASWGLPQNFFVFGGYSHDSLDAKFVPGVSETNNTYSVGAGYHYGLTENMDLVGGLSYDSNHSSVDSPFGGASNTDTGYDVQVGIRAMVLDNLEVNGSVDHAHVGGSANSIGVGIVYSFMPHFAVGGNYSHGTSGGFDTNVLSVFARYYF